MFSRIIFPASEQIETCQNHGKTQETDHGQRLMEKDDPHKEGKDKAGLQYAPDDPIGALLHGFGHQFQLYIIDKTAKQLGPQRNI